MVSSRLLGGDFVGGEMTVNQTGVSKKFPSHCSPKAINSHVYYLTMSLKELCVAKFSQIKKLQNARQIKGNIKITA